MADKELFDEFIEFFKLEDYPRSCVWQVDDGSEWIISIESPLHKPLIQKRVDGILQGPPVPLVLNH